MSSSAQFGLCLSCGAPFLPETKDLSFFNLRGNLSVLYLNEQFSRDPALLRRYKEPKFCGKEQASHMFHDAKHQVAIRHMCFHHTGDSDLEWPVGRQAIPDRDGPIPFYQSEKGTKNPCVAIWERPRKELRLDFKPMLDFFVGKGGGCKHDQNLDIKFPMCHACNVLMTGLSYVRYLIGIGTVGTKNTYGPLIPSDEQPITIRNATNAVKDLTKAYQKWKVGGAASITDEITPFVGYYLHLCLPFDDDPSFHNTESRTCYIEMSWIILMIGCIYNLLSQGKQYSEQQSHGQHQHYGVLEVYVSFFMWRLMVFEFKVKEQNFPMWHQKYFWDAIHLPAFNGRGEPVVSLVACPSVEMNSRDFFQGLCEGLMDLYEKKIRALILFVASAKNQITDDLVDEYNFVKRYFPSRAAAKALGHMAIGDTMDFETALSTVGVNALTSRVIQLCSVEMRPVLKDFRRSWQMLEIDRIRTKTPGLKMLSAHSLYTLCNLLDPPETLPDDPKAATDVLAGPLCSPWTAVISLSYLGAFTDDPPKV